MALALFGCVAALALAARAEFALPPLPFDPNATEPVIDGRTNVLHHDVRR